MSPPYLVLAYYKFTPLSEPHKEVQSHKKFFLKKDISCRIYISEDGINGQLSGARQDVVDYIQWMREKKEFEDLEFKIHHYHENVFPRATIKYRKELVALGMEVDASQSKGHLSPKKWREMMETSDDYLMLDVRNDYEWKIGHFKGATLPPLKNFRDFVAYSKELKKENDPKKTKVMMYCTGGIRCELYSQVMRDHGFDHVYQLEGGVIKYGIEEKGKHWDGKLFVFDDRMSVSVNQDAKILGRCHLCNKNIEDYYNCANMDCNELFLSCSDCLKSLKGCCSQSCSQADRVRPLSQQCPSKPFRKAHHYND